MTIVKFINEVGFKVREGDVKKVNGTISDIKSTATKLLGAIGIGFSLTKINALVEEFGRVNEQVKNSTAALGVPIAQTISTLRFRRKSWSLLGKREAAMRKLQE